MRFAGIKIRFTIFLVALTLWMSGCKNFFHQRYNQGKLVYNIEYEIDKYKNPIVLILPKQMTTYFKDDRTVTTMVGAFGSFKMTLITRPDLNKKYILLRILDRKYMYDTTMDGPPIGFDQMQNIHIKISDTTFIYKNLLCKKALVYCPGISKDTFELIYTEQLRIKNPNVNTPFAQIPGIILKTKLNMLGISMKIELDKFTPENVDNSLFEIPPNYKKVTREELEKTIKSFEK